MGMQAKTIEPAADGTAASSRQLPARHVPFGSPALALATAGVVALLGVTMALWAYYGTAVFYETILAGIAACM
jgi:hypothetical protein